MKFKYNCIILIFVTFFMLSCATSIAFYGENTDGLPVTHYGSIRENTGKNSSQNDIAIKEGNIQGAGFFESFFDSSEKLPLEISAYGKKYQPIVHYDKIYPTSLLIFSDSDQDAGEKELSSIVIYGVENLSPQYTFPEFEIEIALSDYSLQLYHNKQAALITNFSIDGRIFNLTMTTLELHTKPFNGYDGRFFSHPEQVFQITDEKNVAVAEFTHNSYKIFDSIENFDESLLIPCIGIFTSIIHLDSEIR